MIFTIVSKEIGIFGKKEKTAQKIFKNQFKSKLNTLSSKRLVCQTPYWGHGNIYTDPQLGERDTSPFNRFIQDNINKIWGLNGQNIGVRAILGDWDPSAKPEVINQWLQNLPQLKGHIKVFKNYAHFIEESKPKEIAIEIINVAGLV